MAEPDAPIASETTPTEPLAPASQAVTPSQGNDDQASVEALQAQLKKLEMERNLLRKKVDSTSKELESNLNKTLEEKEDYRSVAERALAQLEELQKERQQEELGKARESATSEVFGQFDPKVVEVARTAGLTAADDSETSKEELKTKLQAIAEKVGVSSAPRIQGSNPAPSAPTLEDAPNYVPVQKLALADIVENRSSTARNVVAARKQLQNLKTLDQMREMSGFVRRDI